MTPATRRLPRVLGLFDVTVLASASMGPAYSLASTMGLMIAVANGAAPFALAALVAIMLCIAIAFSQLTRDRPDAGSSFSWAAAAFGPAAGAYAAWMLLLSNYFATVAIALPAATYTLDLFAPGLAGRPGWTAMVAILWTSASMALLYVGMRPTALATALFLLAEIAVVVASSVAALLAHPAIDAVVGDARFATSAVAASPPLTLGGFATAMVLAIWMTDGWEVSASASEETTGGARTPGRGGIAGLLATAAILLFAMIAYRHVGTYAGLKDSADDALTYVARRLGAPWWTPVLLVTVLISSAATLWTTLLYLSRSVFAMGRARVLPAALGRLDERAIPGVALGAIYVATVAFLVATKFWPAASDALDAIVSATSVYLGVLFCTSALAAIRLGRCAGGTRAGFSTGDVRARASLAVPAFGAFALAAVIGVDIAQSSGTVRTIELAGLALGIPFALWRRGGRRRAREISEAAS